MTTFILTVIAFILGFLRAHGIKSILFQAIAHVYVGGLFGAGIMNWVKNKLPWKTALMTREMVLAIGLSLLEVICFLAFKFLG
jgi:hypothetical protein